MSTDDDRLWLREWSWRHQILWFGPLLAVFVFAPFVSGRFGDSASTPWYVTGLVQVATIALLAFGIRHRSVSVDTRTGVVIRRKFLHVEQTDTHRRLRVDVSKDSSLTYAFIRRADRTETYEALCSSHVLIWRRGNSLRTNVASVLPRRR